MSEFTENINEEVKTEEVKPEEVKTEILKKNVLSEYLSDLILSNDNIKEFLNKTTLKIDDKILSILRVILEKSPTSLDKITDNIKDILNDGVIDHKDIPKLLILVTNLYKTDFKQIILTMSLTSKEIVEFIKTLIKLIIDLDIVHTNNKNETFELIDVSSELLELVIPSQEISVNCSIGFFNNLFNKK